MAKLNMRLPVVLADSAPDSSTPGWVGLLAMDTSQSDRPIYKCIKAEGGVYTWKMLEGGGSGGGGYILTDEDKQEIADLVDVPDVVQQKGNREDAVMSQAAATIELDMLSSSKLDANKLGEAVDIALAQAKESGEFDGAPGEPGADGKSAYSYAVDAGFTGTEEQFASQLFPKAERVATGGAKVVTMTTADAGKEWRLLWPAGLTSLDVWMDGEDFKSNVVARYKIAFFSGTTPTVFTDHCSTSYAGDDCVDGDFVPAASKYYEINIWWSGANWRAWVYSDTTGGGGSVTDADKEAIAQSVKSSLKTEEWTFTLEDGSTVTKEVYVG